MDEVENLALVPHHRSVVELDLRRCSNGCCLRDRRTAVTSATHHHKKGKRQDTCHGQLADLPVVRRAALHERQADGSDSREHDDPTDEPNECTHDCSPWGSKVITDGLQSMDNLYYYSILYIILQ